MASCALRSGVVLGGGSGCGDMTLTLPPTLGSALAFGRMTVLAVTITAAQKRAPGAANPATVPRSAGQVSETLGGLQTKLDSDVALHMIVQLASRARRTVRPGAQTPRGGRIVLAKLV